MKTLLARIRIAMQENGACIQPRTESIVSHHIARFQGAPSVVASSTFAMPSTNASLLVVGLGDPEANHRRRPHNIGYRFVDSLALSEGSHWEERSGGLVSMIDLDGVAITLLKPGVSTDAIGPLVRRFMVGRGLAATNCVVVHDDTDLQFGTARKKRAGGAAGHKGVQSVIAALGTFEFPRIRIGVRKPGDVRKAKDLVVAPFSGADEKVLALALVQANAAIRAFAKERSNSAAAESPLDAKATSEKQYRAWARASGPASTHSASWRCRQPNPVISTAPSA